MSRRQSATMKRGVMASLVATALGGAVAATVTGATTTIPKPGPPVGKPLLPDLVAKPQLNVQMQLADDRWIMRFTTYIVNVGAGDFLLRATRKPGGAWSSEQYVRHATSGAKATKIPARLAWGGDGHNHWHIVRVASVWLVPLDAQGRPAGDAKDLIDTKIGFCFFDHTHELERGPEAAVYSHESCGKKTATTIGMGLSPGWNDTYRASLPGQSIDVTDVADGAYRLWTEVDGSRRFQEKTRANNRTWIDLDLRTTQSGRIATVTRTGPKPK